MSPDNAPKIGAVSYIRVNHTSPSLTPTVAQSIELQRRDCETIATELGVQLTREYVDIGGRGIHRRPVLSQLLDDLSVTRPKYLVTSDLDRLSRHAEEFRALRIRLNATGVTIASWQTLHYGDLVEAIYFAFADFMARDAALRRSATTRQQRVQEIENPRGDA